MAVHFTIQLPGKWRRRDAEWSLQWNSKSNGRGDGHTGRLREGCGERVGFGEGVEMW